MTGFGSRGGKEVNKERRKGSDFLLLLMGWIGVTGWAVLMAVILVLSKAKPDDPAFMADNNMFEQANLPIRLRLTWDHELLTYVFYLLIAGFALGSVGLLINLIRHKRRDDTYRINLILLFGISAAGIGYQMF